MKPLHVQQGDLVLYKLPNGNKLCQVISVAHSSYGQRRIKSHYLKLLPWGKRTYIYSAYDKNIIKIEL